MGKTIRAIAEILCRHKKQPINRASSSCINATISVLIDIMAGLLSIVCVLPPPSQSMICSTQVCPLADIAAFLPQWCLSISHVLHCWGLAQELQLQKSYHINMGRAQTLTLYLMDGLNSNSGPFPHLFSTCSINTAEVLNDQPTQTTRLQSRARPTAVLLGVVQKMFQCTMVEISMESQPHEFSKS